MEFPAAELRLHNTRSKKVEIFKPLEKGKVRMYFCGLTPYDLSHIGHARTFIAADLLHRYLIHLGYDVTYVRNFTDVDDKIITRAEELGEDPLDLSRRFSEEFAKDMDDLQCLPPTKEPRVSEHIGHIIKMIEQIIISGCGYQVEGNVYFSIDSFPDYGKLSSRNQDQDKNGIRVSIDGRKRNPKDFALWKAAKPGEPKSCIWDSPWGFGRPGWHIECSAMSSHFLTHKFDIHGGGQDLEFPHHANEIAQSWASCPESNVSYWVHVGSVDVDGKKMSKSEKNFTTLRTATTSYHPLALRHFMLSVNYKNRLHYSPSQLKHASQAVYYLYQTLQDCHDAVSPFRESFEEGTEANVKKGGVSSDAQNCINKLREEFKARMSDNLDTPYILNNVLKGALTYMNDSLKNLKKLKKHQKQMFTLTRSLIEIEKEVKEILNVLGLLSTSTYAEVLQQLKTKALARACLAEDDVLQLIKKRSEARRNKDFSTSDRIREELNSVGISLMDVGDDTFWRPTST